MRLTKDMMHMWRACKDWGKKNYIMVISEPNVIVVLAHYVVIEPKPYTGRMKYIEGANTFKYMEKMLQNTLIIKKLVKCLKVIAKS